MISNPRNSTFYAAKRHLPNIPKSLTCISSIKRTRSHLIELYRINTVDRPLLHNATFNFRSLLIPSPLLPYILHKSFASLQYGTYCIRIIHSAGLEDPAHPHHLHFRPHPGHVHSSTYTCRSSSSISNSYCTASIATWEANPCSLLVP